MTSEQWLTQHKDNTVGPGCLLHATHIFKALPDHPELEQ